MSHRIEALCVLLIAAVLTIPWLGRVEFYTRGEPREALVVQDIAQNGHWLLPSGYGGVVPSKPPFMHWAAAVFSSCVGRVTEFTVRLASAVASLCFLFFFFVQLARRFRSGVALSACLILLSSVEWFRASVSARVDMVLAALLCGGLLGMQGWLTEGARGFPLMPILAFAAAALTKGPVAIALPGLIFAVYAGLVRIPPGKAFMAALRLFGPAVTIAAVWYVSAALHRPEEFMGRFYYENVARFLGTQEDEPHKHSALYLLGALLLGFLPWTLVLGPGLLRKLAAPGILSRARAVRWWHELDPFNLFGLTSVLLFFVFYSIPSGKRGVYLLPVFPFIALWLANVLRDFDLRNNRAMRTAGAAAVMFVIGVYVLAALAAGDLGGMRELFLWHKDMAELEFYLDRLRDMGRRLGLIDALILAAPLGLGLYLLSRLKWGGPAPRSGMLLLAFFLSLFFAGNAVVFPALSAGLSGRTFAQQIQPAISAEKAIFSYGAEFYGLSFYLQRPIFRFAEKHPENALVVLNIRDIERFQSELPAGTKVEVLETSAMGITSPLKKAALVRIRARDVSG